MTSQDDSPDDGRRTAELGERLAAWLEDLGLGAHLAAVGLPTYERDEHNRPICAVDQATCANVEQQLTGYSANLDVLRQVGLHFGYGPLNRGE